MRATQNQRRGRKDIQGRLLDRLDRHLEPSPPPPPPVVQEKLRTTRAEEKPGVRALRLVDHSLSVGAFGGGASGRRWLARLVVARLLFIINEDEN